MEFLGIGPLELFFIVLIALIILGPKDMVKAGRTLGRAMRSIVTSDTWRIIQQASKDIRNLPNKMIREAGLEDIKKDLPDMGNIRKELSLDELKADMEKNMQADLSDWMPQQTIGTPPSLPEEVLADNEDQAPDSANVEEPAQAETPPTDTSEQN